MAEFVTLSEFVTSHQQLSIVLGVLLLFSIARIWYVVQD